ncbi:hypothetical protein BXY70_3285 [Roseovarius halotolerans]|uniref:Uncharacterized protein n=1 Tax=Roseovarius halotolerans TaxID=505353 RepID=A0A1X6ZRJ8_9RHOB|nr:hypothetical protein [Roseovarius halotolerans]RKT27929.1 hypothetical protein BXY70_3285 [Roseovarius halotolerans]SLN59369.1 hypothetical protein ROH8110_03315 [Roseovarius halotolerans]
MLRPVRTLILMVVLFSAGVFYERYQHLERCTEAGGTVSGGLCRGETG